MISTKGEVFVIIAIIAIVGVFYLSTIREGHDWNGDFGMYIHHAKNIAEGVDYRDTGYIYNPFYPSVGPKSYPPVFPLLLSPVYRWFGLNLAAMKVEIILIFLMFLLLFFWMFRNELPFQYLVAIIAFVGFNPYFWNYKDNILSDIPFLFFVYLSLFFIHQRCQPHKSQRSELLHAILAGFFIYLSYGTRSIGIVLIPCLLICDIIRSKRPSQFAMIATLTFVVFMVLQSVFLHSDSGYFDQLPVNPFAINPRVVLSNFFSHGRLLSVFWDNGYSKVFRRALFISICGLATIGYLARVMDGTTIFEIFLPLYAVPVIIVRRGLRFLIPVIPLFVMYTFVGIKCINSFQRKEIEKCVFAILIVAVFISYAGKYTKMDYGPMEGVSKKESVELFDYIKENTEETDVFIFRRPRILSLFTERSASVYHRPHDDEELWNYFHKIGATYLIVGPKGTVGPGGGPAFLHLFVERHREAFEEVYSNSDFKVYRIQER